MQQPRLDPSEWAAVKDALSDAIDGLEDRAAEDSDNADAINKIDVLYGVNDKITHYQRNIKFPQPSIILIPNVCPVENVDIDDCTDVAEHFAQ